ncbi:MAG: hypothetical protein IJI46_04230 [Erysipelotrichaceae bacterium]|nr:hypothetical protein [Erysipelotrichaceae bacterium]
MISRVFTDCLAELCTLPCIRKSCRKAALGRAHDFGTKYSGLYFSFFASLSEVPPDILLLSGG